jgi:hypothetical protein
VPQVGGVQPDGGLGGLERGRVELASQLSAEHGDGLERQLLDLVAEQLGEGRHGRVSEVFTSSSVSIHPDSRKSNDVSDPTEAVAVAADGPALGSRLAANRRSVHLHRCQRRPQRFGR